MAYFIDDPTSGVVDGKLTSHALASLAELTCKNFVDSIDLFKSCMNGVFFYDPVADLFLLEILLFI